MAGVDLSFSVSVVAFVGGTLGGFCANSEITSSLYLRSISARLLGSVSWVIEAPKAPKGVGSSCSRWARFLGCEHPAASAISPERRNMSHIHDRDQTKQEHGSQAGLGSVKIGLSVPAHGQRPRVHLVHDVTYDEAKKLAAEAVAFAWVPHSVMSATQIAAYPCGGANCDPDPCPSGCVCIIGFCG